MDRHIFAHTAPRLHAWRAPCILVAALSLALPACGDDGGDSASGLDSESDSGGSGDESDSDTATLSAGESESDSDTSKPDPSGTGGESDSGGTGQGTSGGSTGGEATTDDPTTGGVFSTGGSHPDPSTTGEPPPDMPPIDCADFHQDQEGCEAAEKCSPALAERYNNQVTQVCKDEGLTYLGCVDADACEGDDVIYCFGAEKSPYWDFIDGCVPENYNECSMPQQMFYPPC